jgi:hypothetical protein
MKRVRIFGTDKDEQEANNAVASLPPAFVIYVMASNGLQQTQSAGSLD